LNQAYQLALEEWQNLPPLSRPDDEPDMPSSSWHLSFLKRHKDLEIVLAKPLEVARHDNGTDETIRAWFDTTIMPLYRLHQYELWMIANSDESFLELAVNRAIKIIKPKLNGYKRIKEEPGLSHMTIVPTVFANGDHARTLLIYPCSTLPKELTLEDCANDPDHLLTGRAGGWIDKEIFQQYCELVVIPFFEQQRIRHRSPNARGLYIIDGHASRWNAALMQKFAEHGIDVVTLVSHTSHIVQPLDALIFGIFKRRLYKELRQQLASARKRAIDAALLKPFMDAMDPAPPAQDTNILDESVDLSVMETDNESNAPIDGDEAPNSDPLLSTTVRRYILVECAKHCLHLALYRDTVRRSFVITGLSSPPNVETALLREGIRPGPDMQRAENNINGRKKRRRTSINGIILSSDSSLEMLREAEKTAAAKQVSQKRKVTKPKAKRAGK
jgi:hypothetical protein